MEAPHHFFLGHYIVGATRTSQVTVLLGRQGGGSGVLSMQQLVGPEMQSCRASLVLAEFYGKISHAGVAFW